RPQDRLLKVNGLSVQSWSHNSLLDYFRHLALANLNQPSEVEGELQVPLTLDIRRHGVEMTSPNSTMVESHIQTRLKIRNRRSVASNTLVRDMLLSYNRNEERKLRMSHNNNYLKVSPNSRNSVSIGPHTGGGSANCEVCWKIHHYRGGEGSNDGTPVILETPQGGNYIYVPTSTSSSPSIIPDSRHSELESLTSPDVRVFKLIRFDGTSQYSLKHLQTGKYISAGDNGEVVLISSN
ncbi:unnamed protein product, partial [Meganyctiphanes norvegica]